LLSLYATSAALTGPVGALGILGRHVEESPQLIRAETGAPRFDDTVVDDSL
jgi:hypothetical protein